MLEQTFTPLDAKTLFFTRLYAQKDISALSRADTSYQKACENHFANLCYRDFGFKPTRHSRVFYHILKTLSECEKETLFPARSHLIISRCINFLSTLTSNAETHYLFAHLYASKSHKADHMDKALSHCLQAHTLGCAPTCGLLILWYATRQIGKGLSEDELAAKAMSYFEEAKSHGDATSVCVYARLFLHDYSVFKHDYPKALELFQYAANVLLDSKANRELGDLYALGRYWTSDPDEARYYYNAAKKLARSEPPPPRLEMPSHRF